MPRITEQMIEDTPTPAGYRARAERMRAIAAQEAKRENRDLLNETAADYERMARDLEATEQLMRRMSKR